MIAADIDTVLAPHGLALLGSLKAGPGDDLPPGTESLALIGPGGPAFWEIFIAAPEYADGAPDPLDRWSERVIGAAAAALGATALFPFGGPPYRPFIAWALRTGRVFRSPVTLLVHDTQGLFVSFRGALALREPVEDARAAPNPCESCATQPCRSACPVGALSVEGYDVSACRAFLDTAAGGLCYSGCRARRACPVGAGLRPPAQSAFHMEDFHPRTP